MINLYTNQRGTQITDLSVMFSRCFHNFQQREHSHLPTYFGCSFFKYTKIKAKNIREKKKRKKETRKDNKNVINPAKSGYGKWIMERSEQNPLNLIRVKDTLTRRGDFKERLVF